ncbi:MAG: hypothetical protein NZT61_04965 [Deltaproteobacteria bacterium]|nr:hypothetical protein [Deltaproteobacteria bacterium]
MKFILFCIVIIWFGVIIFIALAIFRGQNQSYTCRQFISTFSKSGSDIQISEEILLEKPHNHQFFQRIPFANSATVDIVSAHTFSKDTYLKTDLEIMETEQGKAFSVPVLEGAIVRAIYYLRGNNELKYCFFSCSGIRSLRINLNDVELSNFRPIFTNLDDEGVVSFEVTSNSIINLKPIPSTENSVCVELRLKT